MPGVIDERRSPGAIRRAGRRTMLLCVALLLVAFGGGAAADEPPGTTTPDAGPTNPSEEIRAIEAVRAEVLSGPEDGAPGAGDGRATELREEIDRTTAAALRIARELAAAPDAPEPVAEREGPATLARLAELYDEIAADSSRLDDLETALEASREARAQAEEARESAERAVRQLERDGAADPGALAMARLTATAAAESARLARLEERQIRRDRDALARGIAAFETRATDVRAAIRSQGDEPDASVFADREETLRRRIEATARRRASLDLQVEAASERYRRRSDPSPDLLGAVESLRAVRDLAARQEAVLRDRLERLQTEEELWSRWHRVLSGRVDEAALPDWLEQAAETRRALGRERARAQGQLATLRESIDGLRGRMASDGLSATAREALESRLSAQKTTEELALEQIRDLDRSIQLAERLEADATETLGTVSIGERVAHAWSQVRRFFGIELTSVADEPITIGKAMTALFLLIAGAFASSRASRGLGNLLERRGRLEPGVAGAVQTGLFYALLTAFTLFALNLVNFPLTAFTVAGGALAIGIGFGSQNVLNNFISGLILMFERPVRSHDLVEVEGTHGTIERIGLRSTRIRAQDGRHIVVPNSFFLENNVINWTLSDELMRGKLEVGVVYGSDTARVDELIGEALHSNPRVLDQPAPIINFANFGDDSLVFHIYFWTRSRTPMGIETVMSQLRYEIDRLFREAGIVIAFPQRDVHLDSTSPVQIALVEPGAIRRTERTEEEPE